MWLTFLLWHAVSGGQLLPGRGLLILNVVVLFFTLALPFRSFVHSCSSWQPLDHLHCVLRQWYHVLAMLFRLVNGGNSLGTAGTAERLNCRLMLIPLQLFSTTQLPPVQLATTPGGRLCSAELTCHPIFRC